MLNPSPYPTNNVGRVYPEFQLFIGWGEGELQGNFEKDASYVSVHIPYLLTKAAKTVFYFCRRTKFLKLSQISFNCKSTIFIVALHSFLSGKHHNKIASEAAPASFHMHLSWGTLLIFNEKILLDPRSRVQKSLRKHSGDFGACIRDLTLLRNFGVKRPD